MWRTLSAMVVVLSLGAAASAQNPPNNGGGNNGGGNNVNGTFLSTSAVGGVSINVDGVLNNTQVDQLSALREVREKAMQRIAGNLMQFSELRKVSLRGLQEAIAAHRAAGNDPLPDDVQLLAGLQKIQYVFVYPDQQDIVIAGPAEGWRVDELGNIVGASTGRAVMRLEDLAIAIRTGRSAAQGGLSCSIDPTNEGLRNLNQFVGNLGLPLPPGADMEAIVAGIEQSLGPQTIAVNGVEATTPFAHIMVAADYRMKRLAMGFETPPVRGLPSYLQMTKAGGRGVQNMMPRWWLAPDYDPLLKDQDGLAWELRGAGVKAMTEEDFASADGSRSHTGKAGATAQKWADNMTKVYEELSVKDPIFAELRNIMDMAVLGALIVKEQLAEKSGCSLDVMMDESTVTVQQLNAPTHVATQGSLVKKGRDWVISASGGVEISSWAIADKHEESSALAPVRDAAAKDRPQSWWWD